MMTKNDNFAIMMVPLIWIVLIFARQKLKEFFGKEQTELL